MKALVLIIALLFLIPVGLLTNSNDVSPTEITGTDFSVAIPSLPDFPDFPDEPTYSGDTLTVKQIPEQPEPYNYSGNVYGVSKWNELYSYDDGYYYVN